MTDTGHNAITELDQILIRDLLVRCIVGINPDERKKKQDVLINMTLYADLRAPGASDDIDDAVDYKKVNKQVFSLVEESSFFLVERMAEEIARVCLQDPRVKRARVRVEKPGALRFARSVGVEIVRDQSASPQAR